MNLKAEHLQGLRWTGVGKDDCFSLGRKFFKDNFDIDVPDFARPSDWEADKLDLIRNHYEDAGFGMITDWKIKDLRPADVLVMAINESNPNHIAIYLGEGLILHHLYGKMSRIEELHGFWRNRTSFILRHKDVPDLTPVYPDVDFMELLRARNSPPQG